MDLLIGHPEIDIDHKIATILYSNLAIHPSLENMQLLHHFCKVHFNNEEYIMEKSSDPHYKLHKTKHRNFLLFLDDAMETEKSAGYIKDYTISFIGLWLDKHHQTVDSLSFSCNTLFIG